MTTASWTLVDSSTTTPPSSPSSSGEELARNLKIGSDGDLELEGGQLSLVRGLEAVAQDVRCRLRTIAGEWFADQTIGVPYFEEILVKNPRSSAVRSVFHDAIAETPGVLAVTSIDFTFTPGTRALEVRYTARADLGELSETVEI